MTVGIPGAGIGGLFYLANALLFPVRGLVRRSRGLPVRWRTVLAQFGLALGILFGIWLAGWMLGAWVPPASPSQGHSPLPGAGIRTARLLGAATILLSFTTLGTVLLSVQLLRWGLRRRA